MTTSTPGGITWEMAMTKAGEILSVMPKKWSVASPEVTSSRAAQAQAWIAYARELTMHDRAQR